MEAVPYLDRLDDDARTVLEQHLKTRPHPKDGVIISENENSLDVFFVLTGTARVTIFSEDGKVVAYRDIAERDIFGEFAAIDGAPRSATVVAVEDLTVGRLPVEKFRELNETNPAFTWATLQHMTQQCRQMTERIFEYSTMLVRHRLIAELVRLAQAVGVKNGGAILAPAPTHFDLASKISTHREAVSREMSRLSKLDLISKKSGNLIIHDIDQLMEMR